MARGKSGVKYDKTREKSVVHSKEKLTGLKTINKEVDVFDGVDSLVFLKDTKEKKKLNDVDERFMLLKSELKSLIDGTKSSKECGVKQKDDLCNVQNQKKSEDINCNELSENAKNPKEPVVNNGRDFKPSFSSTPCKFTEWLDTTINETSSQCHARTGQSYKTNSPSLISEPETASCTLNRFPTSSKVEELLYKSFVLQNCGKHLSELADHNKKNIGSESKINPERSSKCKKTCTKSNKDKMAQKKNKSCKAINRGRKKRILSLNTSESEVEVITLDSTSINNGIPRTNPYCTDEDVSNYDWDEPFDINDDSDDVQIVNNSEAKDTGISNKGVEPNSIMLRDSLEDSNVNPSQGKKTWECPVCFERSKGQEIAATQCGHVFCRNCIESHTSTLGSNCPTCRADLKNKPLITLFNF